MKKTKEITVCDFDGCDDESSFNETCRACGKDMCYAHGNIIDVRIEEESFRVILCGADIKTIIPEHYWSKLTFSGSGLMSLAPPMPGAYLR